MDVALATDADVPGVLAIYAPLVRDTCVSWEFEPPTLDEMRARVSRTTADGFPWLVAREGEAVRGYAYAHPFRARRGYRFTCESSIYVHEAARGRGLGLRLYEVLFEILRRQGFAEVIAGVTMPNDASLRLHERAGFRRVGTFERIGDKQGRALDATFLQRTLAPRVDAGDEPTPLRALLEAGALDDLALVAR